jgi:hypothetical protein
MKKIITSLTLFTFITLTSCGPDSLLVQDGIVHSCNLKKIEEKMKIDPNNAELNEEYIRTVQFLNDVIDSEEESKRDDLKKAINEGSKDCK